jgi:ATP-dependent RNA helicase DeaD
MKNALKINSADAEDQTTGLIIDQATDQVIEQATPGFKDFGLPESLLHRLDAMNFKTPTPVQVQAIPVAMEGKDILGSAQTGTGKTGAFGIPLVTKLLADDKAHALILLPTRELAVQVIEALQSFIGKSKLPTALLIGGDSMEKQIRQLRAFPRLVVGTPGRINDHLRRRSLKLDRTNFLVLDEVDRMLDMGFSIQLDDIAEYLSSQNRQTLMFSATLPKNILNLAKKYLTDPVRISVGSTHAPAKNIKQEEIKISDQEKQDRLLHELNEREGSVIVFMKTKHNADRMAKRLRDFGHKADALHGDLRQNKRQKVINQFRKQNFRILVATDVAARGLDVPHIEIVINYNLPECPEDYIHRIGRTARAGAEGVAINFISPVDRGKWAAIQRLLNPGMKIEGGFDEGRNGNRRRSGGGRSAGPRNGQSRGRSQGGFSGGRSRPRSDDRPQEGFSGGRSRPRSDDRPQGGFAGRSRPRSDDRPQGDFENRRPRGRSDDRPQGDFENRRPRGRSDDRPQGDFENRRPRGRSDDKPRGDFQGKPRGNFQGKPGAKPGGRPGGKPGGRPQGKSFGKPNDRSRSGGGGSRPQGGNRRAA